MDFPYEEPVLNVNTKIAVIDYGVGNIKSITNAITKVQERDADIFLTRDPKIIFESDILVLPGVGAFPDAMTRLEEYGLVEVLTHAISTMKKPSLGICLGMQLLFESSEENQHTKGLGLIPGKVVYIEGNTQLRVPHIGWNSLELNSPSVIFDYLGFDKDFYFVNSLYVDCHQENIIASFEYGVVMAAAVQRENWWVCNFTLKKVKRMDWRL